MPTVLQMCRLLKPPDDCCHALTKLVAKDCKKSKGENTLWEEGFKVNVPWLPPGFCHIRPWPAVQLNAGIANMRALPPATQGNLERNYCS
jgi:hypothetical protein